MKSGEGDLWAISVQSVTNKDENISHKLNCLSDYDEIWYREPLLKDVKFDSESHWSISVSKIQKWKILSFDPYLSLIKFSSLLSTENCQGNYNLSHIRQSVTASSI